MLAGTVRALLVGFGVLATLAGLLTAANIDLFGGLWLIGIGLLLIVGGLVERRRYRSATAEDSGGPTGPGGGELPMDPLERRFRPTTEVFVDPTTGHRMRVLVDPATGERRYRAEG